MSITHAQDRLAVVHDDQPQAQDPHDTQDTQDTGGTREDRLEDPAATASGPVGVRPTFTITEAAAACAVSRKTITRKLVDLAGHGAAKDDDGIWRIPVEALLALGLHPGRSVPAMSGSPAPRLPSQSPAGSAARPVAATTGAGFVPAGPDMVSIPRDRWDDLRIRLARAEAEAAERALALADARLALRALTAGPAAGPGPAETAPQAPPAPQTAPAAAPVLAAPPSPRGQGDVAPGLVPDVAPAPGLVPEAAPAPDVDELASARSHAARTGGYVPAAGAPPVRKRRWWQGK